MTNLSLNSSSCSHVCEAKINNKKYADVLDAVPVTILQFMILKQQVIRNPAFSLLLAPIINKHQLFLPRQRATPPTRPTSGQTFVFLTSILNNIHVRYVNHTCFSHVIDTRAQISASRHIKSPTTNLTALILLTIMSF